MWSPSNSPGDSIPSSSEYCLGFSMPPSNGVAGSCFASCPPSSCRAVVSPDTSTGSVLAMRLLFDLLRHTSAINTATIARPAITPMTIPAIAPPDKPSLESLLDDAVVVLLLESDAIGVGEGAAGGS